MLDTKSTLTAVIIEDDANASTLLKGLIERYHPYEFQVKGIAGNLNQGIELLKIYHPDVVFLDIDLPGMNGLELFTSYPNPEFKVICTTAFTDYALEAINQPVSAYLLKPIDIETLNMALQKVKSEILLEAKYAWMDEMLGHHLIQDSVGKVLLFEVENGFLCINSNTIAYCYASQSYSVIVNSLQEETIISKPLKELQEMLPADQFYRTHKSWLVNIRYVKRFFRGQESYVLLKSGVKIPVSVRVGYTIGKDLSQILNPT